VRRYEEGWRRLRDGTAPSPVEARELLQEVVDPLHDALVELDAAFRRVNVLHERADARERLGAVVKRARLVQPRRMSRRRKVLREPGSRREALRAHLAVVALRLGVPRVPRGALDDVATARKRDEVVVVGALDDVVDVVPSDARVAAVGVEVQEHGGAPRERLAAADDAVGVVPSVPGRREVL